jgi:hypothetical protein
MIAQLASVFPHGKKLSYPPKTTGASRDNQAIFKPNKAQVMLCCRRAPKHFPPLHRPAIKTMPNTL